jgi:hypothetical protein
MDIRGDAMAVGEPMVDHLREGDHQANIAREHLCHLVNDEFVGLVEEAAARISPGRYLEMMQAMTEQFRGSRNDCSPILGAYVDHLVGCLDAWTSVLSL